MMMIVKVFLPWLFIMFAALTAAIGLFYRPMDSLIILLVLNVCNILILWLSPVAKIDNMNG
jgi:hypothetical protein